MSMITAIVPTFNDQHFIERCLCSVIDQMLDDVQIIVVDRGSTDQTRQIIQCYKSEVDQIIDAPGTTMGTAINRALLHATGRYITILPGDCLLLPCAIETVCNHLSDSPKTLWLASSNLRIDVNDQFKGQATPVAPGNLAEYLSHNASMIPSVGVFWRKALADQIGLFDNDLEDTFDYDFYCRLLIANHHPTLLGKTLGVTREYESTNSSRALNMAEQSAYFANKYVAYLPKKQRETLLHNCELHKHLTTEFQTQSLEPRNSQEAA